MNRGSWQLIAEASVQWTGVSVALLPGSWGVVEDSLTWAGAGAVDLRLSAFAAGEFVAPDEYVDVHIEGSAWSTPADTGNPYWLALTRTGFAPPNDNVFRIEALVLSAGVVSQAVALDRVHFRAWRRAAT